MKKLLAVILALVASFASAQTGGVRTVGFGATGAGSIMDGCSAITSIISVTAGVITCNPALVVNGSVSTAGRSILTIRDSISGASTSSNFLNITGRFPSSTSAGTIGAFLVFTTSASDSATATRSAVNIGFSPETSNNGLGLSSRALAASNSTEGGNSANPIFNGIVGITGTSSPAVLSAGAIATGVLGSVSGNSANPAGIGVAGYAILANAPASAFGVVGRSAIGSTSGTGGFFEVSTSQATPRSISTAIYGGNTSNAVPLLVLADNDAALPTTGATATFNVLDGAQAQCGNCVLTSSTMTASNQAEMRTVTHSYAWTNAMLVALGASLTGDVNVAVLPAKTQINNAYVVIDSPGTDANTLTVSCGDTGAGANNYILAADAKAAANTLYGDAAAERGTAIDVEFYYVPSYTATTTISCRFTKTVANLSTQTGSTGRVILTTTLLP